MTSSPQTLRDRLLPNVRWPSRDEAKDARWFSPVSLGPVTAGSRTWVPAMVPWRASADGFVTPEVLAWYERFAKGQPGVLVVEATGVRDVPSGPLLRATSDGYVEGLKTLVDTVRRASGGATKLFVQLIDFLPIKRRPTRERFLGEFLAIDEGLRARLGTPWLDAPEAEVREHLLSLRDEALNDILNARDRESLHWGFRQRVTDVDEPTVAALPRLLPQAFANAAKRCIDAGFDGIELHFAHAYTLASFLSALNTRADGYGGSREHRLRLPLEVFAAVRAAVGPHAAVGARFLTDEIIAGGGRPDDAAAFAVAFARAGFDFLSLSRGGKFEDARQPKVGAAAYPYTGPSGHECMPTTRIDERGPFGRNLEAVAAVKAAVVAAGFSTPVVACGGIATFEQAESVLVRGDADLVASARQSLADPDWFLKVREGRGAEIRRCVFTNYCEALDQKHQPVTCQLWDRAPDGSRRWVAP